MNLKLWIFPILTVILNILTAVALAGQLPFFNYVWILTAFVPLMGIALAVYNHRRLNVSNMILLIVFNVILLVPFVFWCYLLMVGMALGGLVAADAWSKYANYIITMLVVYFAFIIGCIIRAKSKKGDAEPPTVDPKRFKQGGITILIISLIGSGCYWLARFAPSISKVAAGLDLYTAEFQTGEEITAYTKTDIVKKKGLFAFRSESQEPLNSYSKPVYKLTVHKVEVLDESEKLANNLSKEKGTLIAIDIDILVLDEFYFWDNNSFRVRDQDNNWLKVVKRTENFVNKATNKPDRQRIFVELETETEYVDFIFHTDKWNSSNSATAKIRLDIQN